MVVTRPHTRGTDYNLADGTTNLADYSRNEFGGGVSLLRTRLQLELYVDAVSSTGNLVNFAAMEATRVAVGIIAYDTPTLETTAPFPVSTPDNPSGSLGWLAWEPMYPTVTYYKESDVEVAGWVWRTDPPVIDVQTRRATTPGNVPSWWWSYEIREDSGTAYLNQTVAGTTYGLGRRLYYDVLYEQIV